MGVACSTNWESTNRESTNRGTTSLPAYDSADDAFEDLIYIGYNEVVHRLASLPDYSILDP